MKFFIAAVSLLLSSYANAQTGINSQKSKQAQPSQATIGFCTAFSRGNLDMMDLYLSQGADINTPSCDGHGSAAIHMLFDETSGYQTSVQLIRYLVAHGANVNQVNINGQTPLMLAPSYSQYYGGASDPLFFINILISNGADVLAQDKQGNSTLDYVKMARGGEYAQHEQTQIQLYQLIMQRLISVGANVNNVNLLGETNLMHAADRCAEFSVQFLLQNQADYSIRNRLNKTALDLAIEKATNSSQGSNCTRVAKILNNVKSLGRLPQGQAPNASIPSSYVGTYSGTYSGGDRGTFQAVISSDGGVTLTGRSLVVGQSFSGEGKVGGDGILVMGFSATSTGATFNGAINPNTGVLSGSWQNTGTSVSGSFSGQKGALPQPTGDLIQDLGSLFRSISGR